LLEKSGNSHVQLGASCPRLRDSDTDARAALIVTPVWGE
jgi:hypothetical protein